VKLCERPFALYRKQHEKDKGNCDVGPRWKTSCGRPWMHWFRSDSWIIKCGTVWFNSFKSLKSDEFL